MACCAFRQSDLKMKDATLQTLITARTLFDQAERLTVLNDRYQATAALIVLQDAVELILLAVLIEKDVSERTSVDSLSFDQMIGEVRKLGIKIPKSDSLKAMNKLRVTAKHYGQIMEPLTVQSHISNAKISVDAILVASIGKTLKLIFLTELVGNSESRPFLDTAAELFEAGDYSAALLETRKAYYVEFVRAYNVYSYRGANDFQGIPELRMNGGWKAPAHTRDPHWLEKNILAPGDYIQIDQEKWRIDAMEWGINTQTLNSIESLTPAAVQLEINGPWYCRQNQVYFAVNPTRENASLALDLTIEVIRRKHEHYKAFKHPDLKQVQRLSTAYIGSAVLVKADDASEVIHILGTGDVAYNFERLHGLDAISEFFYVQCSTGARQTFWGFVKMLDNLG